MPHIASIAGPVRRLVVEAYQNIDTGGPEAMVQLALALDSLCPGGDDEPMDSDTGDEVVDGVPSDVDGADDYDDGDDDVDGSDGDSCC